ncbi:MAG TPA: AAA family ATPase [Gemmatimonadales bacterium]|nr:AAA family ATPase [Gemmatimonadales bacterium]
MQPPPFVLNCLGTPRLLTAGGQEVRIKVKKHLAVLVILAVDGGKIRRERLVSMLWPTARPDRARGSVATAISVLRAKLGSDAIEPGRDWVQLSRRALRLDVDRLIGGNVLGDDFTPALEVDAFLAGFDIGQSSEFDNWKERQHARLLPSVEKALISLADHARRSGDLNNLGLFAERLLSIDDLSEAGIQARMEAYALSGDRITAIRTYEDWSRRLRNELNAVPGRKLEDLANRLRRFGVAHTPSDTILHTAQTEQWRNQHFVGRTREYRNLTAAWERSDQNAQHLLMLGDSGVGKTTLVDRFATAVALQGATVARTRCFELESSIPYAMIGSIVQALLNSPGAAATSPRALSELSCLVPAVRRRFQDLPAQPEMAGESARLRFAEAALEYFETLSEERHVLVTVDDINLSDEASIAVLHLILRRTRGARIMFVLTWRDTAFDSRDELTRLRSCHEELGLQLVTVEPLSPDACDTLFDLLASELGASPTTSQRRGLIRCAGGLPLALELFAS